MQVELLMLDAMANAHKGSSTLTKFSEDLLNNYNNGKRIYVNRLQFYNPRIIEEHMISFKQLMYKDLGLKDKLKGNVHV